MKIIRGEKVLEQVMLYINKSKKSISMTMNFEDNSINISKEYYNLLNKKISQGVKIKRLCFGNVCDYKNFKKNRINDNANCRFSKIKNYKRMIVIDEKYLFCRKDILNKLEFLFLNDNKSIKKYLKYFNKGWFKSIK